MHLNVNAVKNIRICCDFKECPYDTIDTIPVVFYYGWNCDSFPVSLLDPSVICKFDSVVINVLPQNSTTIVEGDLIAPTHYSLCKPFEVITYYQATGGVVYPKSFNIDALPPGLSLVGVEMLGHDSIYHVPLVYNQGTHNYPITTALLNAVHDSDLYMDINEPLYFKMLFVATCAYSGQATLPDWNFNATNYCGDTIQYTAGNRIMSFSWDGTSYCDSCITVTKTVSPNYVAPFDTITFTIHFETNNQSLSLVQLFEQLPPNFHITSTIPSIYQVLPSQGVYDVFVTGYYDTPGNCLETNNHVSVFVPISNDTLSADACVTVYNPCIVNADIVTSDGDSSNVVFGSNLVQNKNIYINGRLWITEALYFKNCHIVTAAGASIINFSEERVTLDSTVIEGCDSMWLGVDMSQRPLGNELLVKNHSAIKDASIAIKAGPRSSINCFNSILESNDRAIYFPSLFGTNYNYNGAYLAVIGCNFGLSSPFKPDFHTQTPHGIWPTSGVEVFDLSATIGGLGSPNTFSKLNNGIIANRSSNIYVSNVIMDNIKATSSTGGRRGVAIQSIGSYKGAINGSLRVDSLLGPVNITRANYGIVTNYSNLVVSKCSITNSWSCIESRQCTDQLSTSVTECTLQGRKFGINWMNNNGAKYMYAAANHIMINNSPDTSVTGISCKEIISGGGDGHYQIEGNYVTLGSNGNGIWLSNIRQGQISHNVIFQNNINANSNGINLEGNSKTIASCNIVIGDTNQLASVGIRTILSDGTSINCNNVSENNTGFYFGGTCGNTDFKGNAIGKNNLGLYLNNVASIGTQNQEGNRWINYNGPIGAFNANIGGENLSQFIVNTPMGQIVNYVEYFPLINATNLSNGWFVQDPGGIPYNCQSSNACGIISDLDSSIVYERAIAQDSIETLIYKPETQYQANEYLYEYLVEHPLTIYNDMDFQSFFAEHQNSNIGELYAIERDLSNTGTFISNTLNLVRTIDSVYKITLDSLFEAEAYGWQSSIERMNSALNTLTNTRQAIIASERFLSQNQSFDNQAINNSIMPTELPETNRIALNDVCFRYTNENADSLINVFSFIYSIANQCSYAGGKAVIQARAIIHMLNDTIEFSDDALCLTNGIYRLPVRDYEKRTQQVFVNPNPAKNKITISILNKINERINISVNTMLGVEVIKMSYKEDDMPINVDVSYLLPGIYEVKVTNINLCETKKLIITR